MRHFTFLSAEIPQLKAILNHLEYITHNKTIRCALQCMVHFDFPKNAKSSVG